ncbi:MAG: hypothetical protein OXT65_04260 [Alphaproteobacteria bacterium]|nr:hypothetical protein [Alphaproteobacteria bacterium]
MNQLQKVLAGCGIAAIALASHGALAASDGSLGSTSTGTSDVSLSIAAVYQITGLADLALGAYAGTGNMTGNDDVCVYTNDASGNYNVRITDSSTLSAADFSVQNAGSTSDIPFTVSWDDGGGASAVTYNTQLASANADTSSTTCSGGTNANFAVDLLQADLQAAPADSYSTTLTIVIEP